MADRSAIEWTDATWNPVTGCTKVSPGCEHCYAERITERFHGKGSFAEVTLHHDRVGRPLSWRKPRRVFVNSMSDLFHVDVPTSFIQDVFIAMALARQHTFQILTKRPGRARSLLSDPAFRDTVHQGCRTIYSSDGGAGNTRWTPRDWQWPPANVWLGVSAETQQWADIRIPALLDTPAAVRFVSAEPHLGPIDLTQSTDSREGHGLDWVIVGGESGPHARPIQPAWARSLRDQCHAANVAFFFKQWGGRTPKANGRELDGRTHDEQGQA